MDKSKNLSDKEVYEILQTEIDRFNGLAKGHKKLLEAIGNL